MSSIQTNPIIFLADPCDWYHWIPTR